MAKSLSSILSQIERLQKEAASIQLEVIDRMRKEIAKYSLTPEQLFGQAEGRGARAAKPAKNASMSRAAKYAGRGLGRQAARKVVKANLDGIATRPSRPFTHPIC